MTPPCVTTITDSATGAEAAPRRTGDLVEGTERAVADDLERLGPGRRRMPVLELLKVFVDHHPLAVAELALAHAGGQRRGCQAESVGDDPRRLVRTDQRAGVDRMMCRSAEQFGGGECVGAAGVVQWDVGGTLDASIEVPVGLAVTDEGVIRGTTATP